MIMLFREEGISQNNWKNHVWYYFVNIIVVINIVGMIKMRKFNYKKKQMTYRRNLYF